MRPKSNKEWKNKVKEETETQKHSKVLLNYYYLKTRSLWNRPQNVIYFEIEPAPEKKKRVADVLVRLNNKAKGWISIIGQL